MIVIPWVAALAQWCLGVPPSVYMSDGTPILEQPESQVRIIAVTKGFHLKSRFRLEITIHRSLGNPTELIVTDTIIRDFAGMVGIEQFGRWLMRVKGFSARMPASVLEGVLPFALKQVVSLLRTSVHETSDLRKREPRWPYLVTDEERDSLVDDVLDYVARPFPEDMVISDMLSRVLNSTDSCCLQSLGNGQKLMDLPVVASFLNDLKQDCDCDRCNSSPPESSVRGFTYCKLERFWDIVSLFVSVVLSLSLFDCPDTLLVRLNQPSELGAPSHGRLGKFAHAVRIILCTGGLATCSINAVLQYALLLIGHDVSQDLETNRWVMSSYKGQVVYPKLFETRNLAESGFLTLSWVTGNVRHLGEVYSRGTGDGWSQAREDDETVLSKTVQYPINLTKDCNLKWDVHTSEDSLSIRMGIQRSGDKLKVLALTAPFAVLRNLVSALIYIRCPHPPDSALSDPDSSCRYSTSPAIRDHLKRENDAEKIFVVADAGNDGLRMFSLGSPAPPFPVVLRKDACLSCCVQLCRRAGYAAIIC